jgi:hypothetical protein
MMTGFDAAVTNAPGCCASASASTLTISAHAPLSVSDRVGNVGWDLGGFLTLNEVPKHESSNGKGIGNEVGQCLQIQSTWT